MAERHTGSVEGDLPRSPAAQSSADVTAQQPSAAGYAVGEARTGVEESPRAGQLSPEEVDLAFGLPVEYPPPGK